MKPSAILFDCWGTLFYTEAEEHPFAHFARVLGENLQDAQFKSVFESRLMRSSHPNVREPIKGLLEELGKPYDEALVQRLAGILELGQERITPFPETLETIERLRTDYSLALITNTVGASYARLSESYPLHEWFAVISASCHTGCLKPDPQPFIDTLDALGLDPDEACMVGDSLGDDIAAAERVGIPAILVDRKNTQPQRERRISSLAELDRWL